MSDKIPGKALTVREILGFFGPILGPESNYYSLAVVYGIGISVLSLALPISVQMLVNTIANTGLTTPLIVLSVTLFVLLLIASLLNALRIHLMDLFGRRFYARMVSEIALRSVYALNPYFDDDNNGALFNRYFDIIIVQKTAPNLLVGGFTVLLQVVFGFALVSMYHPIFLAITLGMLLLIWLVWAIWGGRAIKSAVDVSHKKHAAAAWLQGLGASNGFFKSAEHIEHALQRTEKATRVYMDSHVRHFRHQFAQTVCFLVLYAIASAGILGVGGWLVIQGELSLGQLVAAELVLSFAFLGLSQLGIYMGYFYELCGAVDELQLFMEIELEEPNESDEAFEGDAAIDFVNARGDARGHRSTLNFSIHSGARVLATVETDGEQRELADFLKRHKRPESGYVALGGQDIMGVKAHELRRHIIVLDRPSAIEMTIREYLLLSAEHKSSSRDILRVIETVGLGNAISQLKGGLDTEIAATGWPLTITETMQLKLAAAIIAKPKVLVLGQLYDTMVGSFLRRSLDEIQSGPSDTTIIYFSTRPRKLGFDSYLHLGNDEQKLFNSFDQLKEHFDTEVCEIDGVLIRGGGGASIETVNE